MNDYKRLHHMNSKIIIADSSSLILLTRAGLMGYLLKGFQVMIPQAVFEECANAEALKKFEDAGVIAAWVKGKKIKVKEPARPLPGVVFKMDRGEKEALALCLEFPGSLFLSDDGSAIKAAKHFKIAFTVSPLVALDLYRRRTIDYEAARLAIEKLSILGRYLPHFIADILGRLENLRQKNQGG